METRYVKLISIIVNQQGGDWEAFDQDQVQDKAVIPINSIPCSTKPLARANW